jgi:hypothetical protein
MKLTKNRLKILIKEEYSKIIKEMNYQAHALGHRHLSNLEDELYDAEEAYEELEDEADHEAYDGEFGGYGGSDLMDSDYAYELQDKIDNLEHESESIEDRLEKEKYTSHDHKIHKINEDEGLSRGSLYRKRYYGRY